MKLETLFESIETLHISGSREVEIEDIAYDSRTVVPGALFIAIRGHKADGTQYVTEALSNGAVAVVSENELELGAQVTHIQVACARRALAEISNAFYGDLSRKMKMIGVTGTNGKTTTAYMIQALLRDGGFLPGLLGTVAYEVGERSIPALRTTPEAPDIHAMFQQMKEAACDSVVMEVSSHAIVQERIRGIDFDISVFTNLTQDHLDYHKDMDSYFKVKAQLFQAEEKKETHASVINIDDAWGCRLEAEAAPASKRITYGFNEKAQVCASAEKVTRKGTRFHVSTPWGEAKIHLQLLGRFNIHNALAALAVGGLCGIDLKVMAQSLSYIKSIPGRLERIPNRKQIFVDYAHTDDALQNVLSTLREICKGKLIVVFGCGGNRDRGKRKLMGQVAARLADYSILTADNPRNEDPAGIVSDILEGFSDRHHFEVELDRRRAIEKGIRKMERKDILLVAGKGHETYQEFNGTIVPFDDREIVMEILG